MSPEQIEGDRDIDIRSDIYSLGATFYHCLHGKPRFNSTNSMIALYHKTVSPYPWEDEPFSEAVKKLLAKMLESNREKRHSSPQSLIEHCDKVLLEIHQQ